ncbi:hypothetical protein ACFXJ8_18570 [Nonomuraea sp. NPDC059194]|uniref:hypothetical protein n=1 Tax=Nonomuraea sp. NPDC059194 TaxID=3346764 RepID=UPI0036805D02
MCALVTRAAQRGSRRCHPFTLRDDLFYIKPTGALAYASYPLTIGQLARALDWPGPRTHQALQTLNHNPAIAGPMALRRVPPGSYTLTPRLDHLSRQQHTQITTLRPRFSMFARSQAAALHTVISHDHQHDHAAHPLRDAAIERLREAGLIHGDFDRGEPLHASDDVLYSLRKIGPRRTPRWDHAEQQRQRRPATSTEDFGWAPPGGSAGTDGSDGESTSPRTTDY